jgi:hypothetical protein
MVIYEHTAAIGLTASITRLMTSTALLHVSIVLIASSARLRAAVSISVSFSRVGLSRSDVAELVMVSAASEELAFADTVIVKSVAGSV